MKENDEVLSEFVKFGAPEEILYLNKPHIGSDKLKSVVKNMREYLLTHGAKVLFGAKLTDIEIKGGALYAVEIETKGSDGKSIKKEKSRRRRWWRLWGTAREIRLKCSACAALK